VIILCNDSNQTCYLGEIPGPRIQRFIVPCLLLLIKEKPGYGYELMERLGKFGFEENLPDPAAVYRALKKLEENNFVVSHWDTDTSGPARKIYQITPEGDEFLHAWAVRIKSNMKRLSRFLQMFQELYGTEISPDLEADKPGENQGSKKDV
jgi:poly-beta-hydroxybutyrate-responsive repressor